MQKSILPHNKRSQNQLQVQTYGFHYFPCRYLFHLTKEKQKLNYNMFAQVTNG